MNENDKQSLQQDMDRLFAVLKEITSLVDSIVDHNQKGETSEQRRQRNLTAAEYKCHEADGHRVNLVV